jgi:hypothetical protein
VESKTPLGPGGAYVYATVHQLCLFQGTSSRRHCSCNNRSNITVYNHYPGKSQLLKLVLKPSTMTCTASTSSRLAGGWLTPASPGGWRRGCVGTLGATPRRLQGASGPTPSTFWRAQGVGRWRLHGRRGYTKPTSRPTPPRGRESPRVVHPRAAVYEPSLQPPPCGHERPASPAAEAQAQSQDVGWGERRRPARAERCRSRRLRTHSSVSAPPLGHIYRSRLAGTSLQG